MAPPPINPKPLAPSTHPMMREVTEDTPPDLLEGMMDLLVVLPSKATVRMTVNRRTPMMDLLIQVTTANKINPGGHIVLVRNERGSELRYKPSTPIGALDTSTIEIVPKNQVNEYMIVKKPPANRPANQPFESTFRLQVHLPRNQLYVMRVGSKTVLQDILDEVCQEKNLDISKYEMRHPANLDQKLILSNCLGDYGLQQVSVVSKNTKINNTSVSTADILALQQNNDGHNKGLNSAFKYSRSSVGDSSVSSESAGSGCGISRSDDDSRSISPLPSSLSRSKLKLNSTVSNSSSSSEASSSLPKSTHSSKMDEQPKFKKRAAPAPPPSRQDSSPSQYPSSEPGSLKKKEAPKDPPRSLKKHQSLPPTSHSRHSSDSSSGYHEASSSTFKLSDNPGRGNERTMGPPLMSSSNGSSSLNKGTATSLTNLTSVSSLSSTSLASSNGGPRKKGKAPKPPAGFTLQAQKELEEEHTTDNEVVAVPQNDEAKMNNFNGTANKQIEETEKHEYFERKPVTQRSSSSMSSLSSPAPSESNSSSPLPNETQQFPQQQLIQPTPKPKRTVPSPEAAMAAMELDNTVRSSNSQATSVSTPTSSSSTLPMPMAPPRTKPRDSAVVRNSEHEILQQLPQPKPRPRPDRKSNDMELDSVPTPASSSPAAASENARVQPKVGPTNSMMTRIGVKVFPDNALQERAARLASSAPPAAKPRPATAAVDRYSSSQQSKESQHVAPGPDQNDQRPVSSYDKPPLLQSRIGSESEGSSRYPEDYDSDNLEENLELFDVERKDSSNKSEIDERKRKIQTKVVSSDSKNVHNSIDSSNVVCSKSSTKKTGHGTATQSVPAPSATSSTTNTITMEADIPDNLSTGKGSLTRSTTTAERKTKRCLQSEQSGEKESGHLNRWKNHESLHVIDSKSEPPKVERRKTKPDNVSSAYTKSTSFIKTSAIRPISFSREIADLSSDNEDSGDHHHHDENEIHVSSSESDISCSADSGILTAVNVTPSPVSLEHDHIHHEAEKLQTSDSVTLESPLSDHSEVWREILQAKEEENEKIIEKALEAAVQDIDDITDAAMSEDSNFEMSRPESLKDMPNRSESGQDIDQDNGSSSSSTVVDLLQEGRERKLSPSESVSHDTDAKRKAFADTCSSNLKSRSYLSSSEEDLIKTEAEENSSSNKRYTSMQNLSNENVKEKTGKKSPSDAEGKSHHKNEIGKEEKGIQKATSIMGIADLEPEITRDPALTQTFQVELEAQFEQWKKEFLQKHLSQSNMGSKDDQEEPSSNNNDEELDDERIDYPQESKEIDDNSFDPEKPQVIHSVAGMGDIKRSDRQVQEVQLETKHSEERTKDNITGEQDIEIQSQVKVEESSESEMNGNGTTSSSRSSSRNGEQPVYRYSGPPTIQMGTWGERPRKQISVKNDTDYKMGMGQNDAKANSEFRPMLGSAASRVHSFNGGAVASPMLNKSTILPVTRGSSSVVPKVVSNWKQKLESSENERKVQSVTTKMQQKLPKEEPEKQSDVRSSILNESLGQRSVTNSLERPVKSSANFSIGSASSTLERPTKKINAESFVKSSFERTDSVDKPSSLSLQQVPAPPNNGSLKSTHVSTIILNNNSDQPNGNGISPVNTLKEKKAFFQGIKPVESPTKEVPLTAVDMKNNIATIQRVFEKRQQQERDRATQIDAAKLQHRQSSPTLSTSSSYSSLSSKSSNPEYIGGPSQSTLMVQRVLKANSFNIDAFRRSPSPSNSSVSIGYGSRESSSPSPTVTETVPNKFRQSSINTSRPTPQSNSNSNLNGGNKAVIIIGEDSTSPSSNNIFKQQLRVTGTPRQSTYEPSSVKVHVNGTNENKSQVIQINQTETNPNPYGVTLKNRIANFRPETKEKEIIIEKPKQLSKGELNKRNTGPMQLAGQTPTPPPPPIMPENSIAPTKPSSLSLDRKAKSFPSQGSTPTTPMSPNSDPRADIFSAIKNSGGNFKLRKTGTMLHR